MVVEVGDGHLRIAGTQGHHQLRRGQRAATECEEVGFGAVNADAQDVAPQTGQPAHGAAQFGAIVAAGARRWPGKCVAVDFSRSARG